MPRYDFAARSVQLLSSLAVVFAVSQCVFATAAGAKAPTTAAPTAAKTTQQITLGDKLATIKLTPDFEFINEQSAKELLKQEGGSTDNVLGLIGPAKGRGADYAVVCEFEKTGHVSDDDADKLNADEILQAYKDGTQEQNEERKGLNLPPIFVGGWAEKPHYNKEKHEVIWAIKVKDEDSESAPVTSINYNTRILGRDGVLSLNLITDADKLDQNKKEITKLLSETTLNSGRSYADFVPGKDKAAEYGIAGLILGGGAAAAAAKLGLFGAISKWLIAGLLILKKFAIVAAAGVAGIFSKFFGKKKSSTTTAEAPLMPNPIEDSEGGNPKV